MNLELVRLLKYEMTDELLRDFKDLIMSRAEDGDLDSASLDTMVAIINSIYTLPDKKLKAWFRKRGGIEWETIFNAMNSAVSDYLRFRHLADGEWRVGNSAI